MKEGHAPLLLSERLPLGPGLTAAAARPGEGAGRAGPPARAAPWLGPAGTKGGGRREGGHGGSGSRGPALLRAAALLRRGKGAGATVLLPTPPKTTAFEKKRRGEKTTNTAKEPPRPGAEFLSPLISLFFAFVPGRRRPAERDPGGRAPGEAGSVPRPALEESPRPEAERERWAWPRGRRCTAAGSLGRPHGGCRGPGARNPPLRHRLQPLPGLQPESHAPSCA